MDIVPIAQAAQESQYVEAERVPTQIEKALADLQACTFFAYTVVYSCIQLHIQLRLKGPKRYKKA